MREEFWVACEVCGTRGDPLDVEVRHRRCRLKAAFPDANEEKDGLMVFDPRKMREAIKAVGD